MQLESMWVHGLRRFGGAEPVRVRLDSSLVCLIGANEVGKSTLLRGLELADADPNEDPGEAPRVSDSDRTRDEEVPDEREIVRLRYRLEEPDHEVLHRLWGAAQLREVQWLERKKSAGGAITSELVPRPVRDKKPRTALADALEKARSGKTWLDPSETEGTAADPSELDAVTETLRSNVATVAGTTRNGLEALAVLLEERGIQKSLVKRLREVVKHEAQPHPHTEALSELADRIPRFVRFDDNSRNLRDEYELAEVIDDLPTPLSNLAQLAELDLRRLLDKIGVGETGTVKDMLDAANDTLSQRFEAWTQKPPVTVSLDHSGTRLFIHVKSGSGASMRIRERSDGLQQFVALVALTAHQGHHVPPILLIDEAEMHLHYDAQADLIGVLAEQTVASQVIYTTHSAACLPEDLGSAVRVVRGVGDRMASIVDQQFWSEDPGLVPLLLAMGAGSMAFVPLRPAAIVEGGGDLILLPSLMKEAIGKSVLGFQVVPGAARVPPDRIAGLDLHGICTVWILDGDKGGRDRRKFLMKNGVPSTRIFLVKTATTALDLEDLIHPTAYVAAVNAYAKDVGGGEEFRQSDLPSGTCGRHKAVEAWCTKQEVKSPSKTAIATKVVDLRGEMPLLAAGRRPTLRRIHAAALALLEAPDRPSMVVEDG